MNVLTGKIEKLKPLTSLLIIILSLFLLIYEIITAEPIVRLVFLMLLLKIIDLISYVNKIRRKKRHIDFETGKIEA